MQAAPKAIGQVPYRPRYPLRKSLHPAPPLPRPIRRARARGSFFTFLVVASVVLTPLALLNLSIQAYVTQMSYKATRIRGEIETQQVVQERLKVRLTALNSPERVQKVALDKLKMTYPAELSFISLPETQATQDYYARAEKEVE